MKKIYLLLLLTFFSHSSSVQAQTVPAYVSANGLVGWWPFNGNANDESGNGNNGAVNGAALTSDRNGQTSSAYNFNVNNWSFGSGGDNIYIPYNSSFNFSDFTISTWVKRTSAGSTISPQSLSIIRRYQYGYNNPNGETWVLEVAHGTSLSGPLLYGTVIEQSPSPAQNFCAQSNQTVPLNQWCNIILTYSQSTIKLYINNQLVGTAIDPSITINTIGNSGISIGLSEQANGQWAPFDGSIDDIGIWNRALTQQEVAALYNGCSNNITSQPQNQVVTSGNTASFTASSSDSNATYQWQTNFGLGWQNLFNAGQYNGVTSSTLTVSNVTASNNNQAFRCIITSGCVDTSVTAYITLSTGIEDLTAFDFSLYPNPAKDIIHLTFRNTTPKTIQLIDQTGRVVATNNSTTQTTEFPVADLAKGVYTLRVGTLNKMVVIE